MIRHRLVQEVADQPEQLTVALVALVQPVKAAAAAAAAFPPLLPVWVALVALLAAAAAAVAVLVTKMLLTVELAGAAKLDCGCMADALFFDNSQIRRFC